MAHTITFDDDELDCLADAVWRHHMEAVRAKGRWEARGQGTSRALDQWTSVSDRLRIKVGEANQDAVDAARARTQGN